MSFGILIPSAASQFGNLGNTRTRKKLACSLCVLTVWQPCFFVQVLNSDRFQSTEDPHSDYKLDAALTIRSLRPEDLGTYR